MATILSFSNVNGNIYIKDVAASASDTVTVTRASGNTSFRVIAQDSAKEANITLINVVFA